MIEIIVRRDPASPEIEEIGCLRVDDAGNLLSVQTNDVYSLVTPSVRPLRPGESIWRFVERCAAAAALGDG
jgi:hypothetical protein